MFVDAGQAAPNLEGPSQMASQAGKWQIPTLYLSNLTLAWNHWLMVILPQIWLMS